MANKDYKLSHRDLVKYIPERLRNLVNTSLIDNLFNRHMTHDESIPLFGYVGRKPSSPDDKTPAIPQSTVSRDINALVPVFSFKNGRDLVAYTAEDVIRKAQVLGIDDDQSTWLYSQANNYAPPIDFDKFTNFFNYYWVGQSLPNNPSLSWNPTVAPEYYVIAKPAITDLDKLNVRVATTAQITTTGTGFLDMSWVISFTDPLNFTVSATGAGSGQLLSTEVTQSFTLPVVTSESTSIVDVDFVVSVPLSRTLLSFKIQRDPIYDGDGNWTGNESFSAGDTFTITAPFISSSYTITSSVSSGVKGKINNVNSLDAFQTIDDVQLAVGDRVLVKNQGISAENGIYTVTTDNWTRAADFSGATAVDNALVFVTGGTVNGGTLFISSDNFVFTAVGTENNTNDWQEHNYWMTNDEAVAAGFDVSTLIQATRPIIEFSANVMLNTYVQDGVPSNTGTKYSQYKTEFNQIPLFDLYRYDGTHAGLVSPLFFYVEDPTADVDPALQRRTKISSNGSADFLFSHGFEDNNGSLLFCKNKDGSLKTIWHPGYSTPTISNIGFDGSGNGTIDVQPSTNAFAAQQIWTFTATSATTFSVSGSKNAELPSNLSVVTVGVQYDNTLIKVLITQGSTAFEVGDTFNVQFGNLETTRYVYRSEDRSTVYDLFGGPSADTSSVGAWQFPRMFYNNVAAENNGEVPEGTIYSHFRGILLNQTTDSIDSAFGGSIKLWGEQTNLLISLMMQRDMTPISMIDFAQTEYEVALNTVVDIFCQKFPTYTSTSTFSTDEIVKNILELRASDMDVKRVLYDSTAGVTGFPITLPAMGVTPLAVPGYVFDNELGSTVFRHHDGHLSAIFTMSQAFLDRLVTAKTTVTRSDGTITPAFGSYTTTAPTTPYKGELWLYPLNNAVKLMMFNVLGDTSVAPAAPSTGDYWYDRPNDVLYVWNGISWAVESNMMLPWQEIDPADMLNSVLFEIETQLYNNVNAEQRTYFSDTDVQTALSGPLSTELERELSVWAANYGYDQFGSDYVSTDPFTWNYSGLSTSQFAPVLDSTVPARWYKALQSHQATVAGVIPTSRPNLEPWKLLGNSSKPSNWDAMYGNPVTPDMVSDSQIVGAVKAVLHSSTPQFTALSGSISVDGVLLGDGDLILLTSEASTANNGVWVVSNGGWSRAFTPQAGQVVTVSSGVNYSATAWQIESTQTLPSDPVQVIQVKYWTDAMWADIQSQRPTLKLSVDTVREILLPPYVNAMFSASANALTTTLPPTPAAVYTFGQGSPVETVWQKSIEFRYSLARALFRKDPLAFIGNCWGFEWVQVDDILYDSFDVSMPGISRARFHGDTETTVRTPSISMPTLSGPTQISLKITHDGYTADRKFSFSVKTSDGVTLGYLHEGEQATIVSNGYTITALIEDNGVPFHFGDAFTVTANSDGSGRAIVYENSLYVKFLGFGQIFSQCLRNTSIDTTRGFAVSACKNWNVNIGYRAGGLVATDDLIVFADSTDTTELPPSAYTLLFKKAPYASDTWLQALRVTVSQFGSYKIASNGFKVPTSDASDWVFKIQGYNNRYLTVKYYTYDHTEDVTFNALNGAHTSLEWLHPTVKTGVQTAELPLTITGLQAVVDFMFGYSEYLQDQGWEFANDVDPAIDAETGRARNWQLEIEKLVDRMYAGAAPDTGHLMNPFMDKVWFNQSAGLLSEFRDTALFDVISDPAVFDTLGVKLDSSAVSVLRGRETSTIISSIPMFSVHAQTDEYEHLFIFNNYISPSTNEGLIYDPFTGSRVVTMKFNGRRQAADTMRPEFGGHFLIGHEVKENIQASTDKLQHYYDPNYVFRDRTSTLHAMELLGFTQKQYLADLDLTDKSQFEFWRGLIQMKGTNASVDAFLNNNRFQDAKLDEYWAYKVAEYGDARTKEYPELKLYAEDVLQQFTKFRFVSSYDSDSATATFTQVIPTDESRWYSIDDLNSNVSFTPCIIGEYVLNVDPTKVYAPMTEAGMVQVPFAADRIEVTLDGGTSGFTVLNGSTVLVSTAGELRVTGYGPDASKYSPVKVINYVAKEVTAELPLWSPAMNYHTPVAMEDVNIIADADPARYNESTLVSGNANYDPLRAWGAKQVGRIWWDTSNLDYVPYFDAAIFNSIDERLNRWGALADYAANHIAEWVQSTVPPSEYDAQAATDAGNSDIAAATRADGTPYDKKTYSRSREWSVRPIAWSQSSVPSQAAHIGGNVGSRGSFLSPSSDTTLYFLSGDKLVALDNESFVDVAVGSRIGLFEDNDTFLRPISEAEVTALTKNITTDDAGPSISGPSDVNGFKFSVTATSYNPDVYGQVQPSMTYSVSQSSATDGTLINEWTITSYLTLVVNGISSTSLIRADVGTSTSGTTHGATFTVAIGDTFSFTFSELGLTVAATATVAATLDTLAMAQAVDAMAATLYVYDAREVSFIVPNPSGISSGSNDPDSSLLYGWRAWNVPTQAELDADSKYPNCEWYPMVGEYIAFTPSNDDVKAAVADQLTLNNGTVIDRYTTSWGDWTVHVDKYFKTVATTTSAEVDIGELVDTNRVAVYVNGVAQLSSTYSLSGTIVSISTVSVGDYITVILRAYSPTSTELAFDPDTEDDLTIQEQYKVDYQYVSVPVRSADDGTITSTIYYFWVTGRSVAASGKSLSTKAITTLLTNGPSTYMTLQHLPDQNIDSAVSVPLVYDSIALSGLSYLVSKDSTFKLRLMNDNTLRDDPDGLNLKDTHVEWQLIRPGQRTKIPEALWNKLVDTACGADAAGNPLPSPERSAYDERNGTRTQYGFGADQILAPQDLVLSTILYTILNTSVVDDSGDTPVTYYIQFLDFNESDTWFATSESTRNTLTRIWNEAEVSQVNEIFFAVLNDICAANYELTDLFKTSRLSAYSVKVVNSTPAQPTYE